MKKKSKRNNHGYVMLLTTIVFMMVSTVIIFGLSTPIIKQILVARDIWSGKQSYFLSEAGAEDVLYRLKDATYSQQVGSIESITIDGYGATTTFSGSLSGIDGLTVTTLSDNNGYNKKIETKVKKGSGATFIYGLQSGLGGITMTGSSKIIGNVFSNGDITACNGCQITGSAIVSNGSIMKDQSNEIPIPPPNDITFSDTNSTQDIAQSFKVSSSSALTQISFYLKKVGNPDSLTVKIVKNSGSSPSSHSGDVISSAILSSSLVTTNYDWIDVSLSPNPNLTPGTTYWIVLNGSTGSASKKYIIGANIDTNYASGTSKIGSFGGSWSNTGYDSYFAVYLGDSFSKITGESDNKKTNIGTLASDIVWAHNVSYVEGSGPIRCQNDIDNNKSCDQSYTDPSPAPYPISNANITAWKDEAILGGIIHGDYDADSNSILGPKKIEGDVHIGGGAILIVTGTLYITGKLYISGSGTIKLSSSYGANSGIVVVDGRVSIGGSSKATGSGQSGSYMMIVSNSTCPIGSCGYDHHDDDNNDDHHHDNYGGFPAIDMGGSGGAVILNAQKGTIDFSGHANANEATANMITMSGSTVVTYQSGIANANFSTGPSGGFEISGWKELEN